jgi:4,5-dihydroxyphthalate decarboxylase
MQMPDAAQVEVQCEDYEHTAALSGTYGGIAVRHRHASTREMFQLGLQHKPFELVEFSISNYIMMRARGARWLTALPVFPYRAFRHNIIHVLQDSSLKAPGDLRGKTIALPDYSMTAAVWTRGLFQAEYGLDPREINWVSRRNQRFPTPPGVKLSLTDDDLEDLVLRGEVDGLLIPELSDKAYEHGRFRRMLPNHPADERAYFQKTGIYPPNHLMVVNLEVVKDYEPVARAVFAAFASSKARAYERQLGASMVPWSHEHWETTMKLFQNDPLPYGLTPVNIRAVEMVARFLAEQKLIDAPIGIDALFDPVAKGLSEGTSR